MIAAPWPRDDRAATRLLHIDPVRNTVEDTTVEALRTLALPGDLLVVNDAATLPASLSGTTVAGAPVEARLVGQREDGLWDVVLFGAGDWHSRTEDRPPPPDVAPGDEILFDGVRARVAVVDPGSPRLLAVSFDARGDALWRALYRAGRPVQYAYAAQALPLWQVQTAYAARPWAAEAPSAGFPLTWDLMLDLRRRGIAVARLTHAAGLSSTGDAALDARLPLSERYDVPEDTVRAIAATKDRGRRVIAVGTTVTRALEGAAANGAGHLSPGPGTVDLVLGPQTRRAIVDGILTGVHERGTSHYALLESFAPRALLDHAHALAEARGYRAHEFGDAVLILGVERDSGFGIRGS